MRNRTRTAPRYNRIRLTGLDATCVGIEMRAWEKLMKGAVRADKRQINRLVKRDLPRLHYDLALEYYNPYNYFRTGQHLILVHSGIEYFIAYE